MRDCQRVLKGRKSKAIVISVAFFYEEGKNWENFRKKKKQVQVQIENEREKPAEAKELCLLSQWNQYNDLHYCKKTESLIDHEISAC